MPFQPLFIVFGLFAFGNSYGQVEFSNITFEDAVKQANSQGKHVYVNGSTEWCAPCKKMDAETFSDSALSVEINRRFISMKVDLEKGEGIDFAMKFRSIMVPQHLFFDGNGYLIYRNWGLLNATEFLNIANFALDSTPALAPLPHPLDFKLDYPDWYRDFRKGPNDRTFPTDEEIELFLTSRDSLTDEVSWAVLSTLPTPEKYAEVIAENKTILSARYGKAEVLEELSSYVYKDVKQAIKNSSESELYSALRKADKLLGSNAEGYKFRYRLYYYQMAFDWQAYAEVGAELSRNKDLGEAYWLNDLAVNIYQNTAEYKPIKEALTWMYAVIDAEESYPYLLTTAHLEYTLGNRDKAIELTKRGLAAAFDWMDTTEGEDFLWKLERK